MPKTDSDLLRETHDAVIELKARFNGGPGSWQICKVHSDEIGYLKKTVSAIQSKLLMAMGGGFVVLFILERIWK